MTRLISLFILIIVFNDSTAQNLNLICDGPGKDTCCFKLSFYLNDKHVLNSCKQELFLFDTLGNKIFAFNHYSCDTCADQIFRHDTNYCNNQLIYKRDCDSIEISFPNFHIYSSTVYVEIGLINDFTMLVKKFDDKSIQDAEEYEKMVMNNLYSTRLRGIDIYLPYFKYSFKKVYYMIVYSNSMAGPIYSWKYE
ncbi:MAG: hypothetical protein NTU44_02580 [Bacteroidetes bacterium]|nr:hypothetical protein [Bacteroidota bacterium]